MGNEPRTPRCERMCSIYISARDLDPNAVTSALGVAPDGSFRRGDLHEVRGQEIPRPHGSWFIESCAHVTSDDLSDHLAFIATFAREKREALQSLMAHGLPVRARIYWELGDDVLSAAIDSSMLGELCECVEAIDLSVV